MADWRAADPAPRSGAVAVVPADPAPQLAGAVMGNWQRFNLICILNIYNPQKIPNILLT